MEKRYGSSYPYIGSSGSGLASPSLYESLESYDKNNTAMEQRAFIKLSRNFVNWEWFKDVKTTQVFVFLLLSANPKPDMFFGSIIQKGQLVTDVETIRDFSGLSTYAVRKALSNLKNTGYIKTERFFAGGIVITVCDFDQYCD